MLKIAVSYTTKRTKRFSFLEDGIHVMFSQKPLSGAFLQILYVQATELPFQHFSVYHSNGGKFLNFGPVLSRTITESDFENRFFFGLFFLYDFCCVDETEFID